MSMADAMKLAAKHGDAATAYALFLVINGWAAGGIDK